MEGQRCRWRGGWRCFAAIVRRRSPIDWLIVLCGEPRDGRADGGCGRCFFFIRERLYQTSGVITAASDLIEMSGLMGL